MDTTQNINELQDINNEGKLKENRIQKIKDLQNIKDEGKSKEKLKEVSDDIINFFSNDIYSNKELYDKYIQGELNDLQNFIIESYYGDKFKELDEDTKKFIFSKIIDENFVKELSEFKKSIIEKTQQATNEKIEEIKKLYSSKLNGMPLESIKEINFDTNTDKGINFIIDKSIKFDNDIIKSKVEESLKNELSRDNNFFIVSLNKAMAAKQEEVVKIQDVNQITNKREEQEVEIEKLDTVTRQRGSSKQKKLNANNKESIEDAEITGVRIENSNIGKGDYLFFDENNVALDRGVIINEEHFNKLKKHSDEISKKNNGKNSFDITYYKFKDEEYTLKDYIKQEMDNKTIKAKSCAMALISETGNSSNPKEKQLNCLVLGEPDVKIFLDVNINGKKETWELDPKTEKLTRTNEKGEIEEIDKTKLKNIKIPGFSRDREIENTKENTQNEKQDEQQVEQEAKELDDKQLEKQLNITNNKTTSFGDIKSNITQEPSSHISVSKVDLLKEQKTSASQQTAGRQN